MATTSLTYLPNTFRYQIEMIKQIKCLLDFSGIECDLSDQEEAGLYGNYRLKIQPNVESPNTNFLRFSFVALGATPDFFLLHKFKGYSKIPYPITLEKLSSRILKELSNTDVEEEY